MHPLVRERYPALVQALLAGASGQLRSWATTAGNLLQRTRCPSATAPSARLLEETRIDARLGAFVNRDLASYHVPVNADVGELEAVWLDEDDPHVNPIGAKGIGEIGIVGTAAAVANGVHDATGIRVRDLPITPERLLERLPE